MNNMQNMLESLTKIQSAAGKSTLDSHAKAWEPASGDGIKGRSRRVNRRGAGKPNRESTTKAPAMAAPSDKRRLSKRAANRKRRARRQAAVKVAKAKETSSFALKPSVLAAPTKRSPLVAVTPAPCPFKFASFAGGGLELSPHVACNMRRGRVHRESRFMARRGLTAAA